MKMYSLHLLPLLAATLATVSGAPTLRIGGSVAFHKKPDHSHANLLDFALVTSTSTVHETTTETEYVSCYDGPDDPICPKPAERSSKRKRRTLRIQVGDESLRQEQGVRMPELFPSPLHGEDGEQLERILTGSLEGVIAKPKIRLWTATTVTDIYTTTVTDDATTETVATYECDESDTPYPPACPLNRRKYNDRVSNEQSQGNDILFREEPNDSLSNEEKQLEKRDSSNQEQLFDNQDSNNSNNIAENSKEHLGQNNSNEEVSDGKNDEHISDLSEDETLEFIAKGGEVNGQHNSNVLGSTVLAQGQAEQSLPLHTDNEELVTLASSAEFRESTDVEKEENIETLEPVSVILGTHSSAIHNVPGGEGSRDTAINESSGLSLLVPSEATVGASTNPPDQEHSELSNSNLPESSSLESEEILSNNSANLQQVDTVEQPSGQIEPSSFESNESPNEESREPSLKSPITESPSLESLTSKSIESLERDSFHAQPLSSTGEVTEIHDPSTLEEPLTLDSSEQSLLVSKGPGSELSESSTSESSDTLPSDAPQPPILITARPESEYIELSTSPSVESPTHGLSEQPSLVSEGPGNDSFKSSTSESKELSNKDSSELELLNVAEPAKGSSESSVLESIGSLNHDSLEPTIFKSGEEATEKSESSTFESLESQEQDSLKEQLLISTESLDDSLATSTIDSKESLDHDSIGKPPTIQAETGSESFASSVLGKAETIEQDLSEVSLLMDSGPESKVSGSLISESTESLHHDSSEHPLLIATEPESKTPESSASDSTESLQQNSFEQSLLVATEPEGKISESPSLEPAESLHHHDTSEHPVLIAKEPENKTSESSPSESTESKHQDLPEPSPLTLTGPLLEPSDSSTQTEAPHPAKLQVVENVIMHIPLSALPVEESLSSESIEAHHPPSIGALRGLFRSDFEEKANFNSLEPAKLTSGTASVISQESSS